MIQDFDGPDPAPSRRVHIRVTSVALALGMLVAYAAISSTASRGPVGRPEPSATPAARVTVGPIRTFEPVALLSRIRACAAPNATWQRTVVLGDQTVTITQPLSPALPTCPPPRQIPTGRYSP